MSDTDVSAVVIELLCDVAPEIEIDKIDRTSTLRDQIDIDSMDFLNFIDALDKRLGINIPESDYPHFETLDRGIKYVQQRFNASQSA